MIKTTSMTISPEWVDHNGHMNMAYYNVLFDRCVDEAYDILGMGVSAHQEFDSSLFTAEIHVCYLSELFISDQVDVDFTLIAYDEKRLHFFQNMFRHSDQKLCATSEQLALHVKFSERKVTAFPKQVLQKIEKQCVKDITKIDKSHLSKSIRLKSPIHHNY